MKNDMANPNIPIIMTGFRPIRSETLPHIGAKSNCINEYTAINKPSSAGDAPISSA